MTEQAGFAPIFVVGAPRSGTTMLAVLLDRHSRIALPPETVFFCEFLPEVWPASVPGTHEEMVDSALAHERIADLKLDRAAVLNRFRNYESTFPNLLRALLETYTAGKHKIRPGEKSPDHVLHVPSILEAYPAAKVICTIRDGRDVVRSLLKVSWAKGGNPRRFGLFCNQWCDYARVILDYQRTLPSARFTTVKYEDIILHPEQELARLCEFVGESYEPTQLEPNSDSAVVPAWEQGWKGKALSGLDPKRVGAWRRDAEPEQVWAMNSRMGSMLKRLGYGDVGMAGCPRPTRVRLALAQIPYTRPMRPIALLGLRVLRVLRGSDPRRAEQ
ncbi:MAG: sulfotransferase [Planctomycetes bacterium]|nr:sulfotransferase [Planctomycetota bacterium]